MGVRKGRAVKDEASLAETPRLFFLVTCVFGFLFSKMGFLCVRIGSSAGKILEHPSEPWRRCNYMSNAKIYERFSTRDFVRSFAVNSRVVRGHYLGELTGWDVKKIAASGFLWALFALRVGKLNEPLPSSSLTALACVIGQFVPLFLFPRKISNSTLFSGKKP